MRGLVLAGGKSSRFGSDKALARLGGMSLLEKVVSTLDAINLRPIVVTRRGIDYSFIQSTLIYDQLPEKGPLGGLYTAMSVFKNTPFLILTCDMPALTPGVLSGLLASHERCHPVTIYSLEGQGFQPFPGIYEPSLFGMIKEKIKQNDLSMHGLLEATPARKVIRWEGDPAVFCNVNYKKDLVFKS